ncbi:hypothetical protein ACQVP2_19635 [Methylobacterium aquaticum]|uniref:hypothetical protein n=1 Tax=Methylobacterium aquaticum TaxID=270351 RepID=UPI003D17329A
MFPGLSQPFLCQPPLFGIGTAGPIDINCNIPNRSLEPFPTTWIPDREKCGKIKELEKLRDCNAIVKRFSEKSGMWQLMRLLLPVFILTFGGLSPSYAYECDDLPAQIERRTGAKVIGKEPYLLRLNHLAANKIYVSCGDRGYFYAFQNKTNVRPWLFFHLVGELASLLYDLDQIEVVNKVNQCHVVLSSYESGGSTGFELGKNYSLSCTKDTAQSPMRVSILFMSSMPDARGQRKFLNVGQGFDGGATNTDPSIWRMGITEKQNAYRISCHSLCFMTVRNAHPEALAPYLGSDVRIVFGRIPRRQGWGFAVGSRF